MILLTGATGYVGGRLLPRLEAHGERVRAVARRPDAVRAKAATTEVVAGDLLEPASLDAVLRDVDCAYYLVHSMGSAESFEDVDRRAAENFAQAAKRAGVGRIIYLGGLGSDEEALSPHLRSRHEVGDILRASGIPVLEFRASIVIGAGSLSFEMIRALVDRLPLMVTPRWVRVRAQPIAIDDLLDYLLAALRLPVEQFGIYEIGGADQLSYGDIMRVYARLRGRHVRMIPVPVLTPWLSSLWLGLVTPLYARIGRKLVESIVHATVVRDDRALRTFTVRPVGVEEAVRRALAEERDADVASRWHDARSSTGIPRAFDEATFCARLSDVRTIHVPVPADVAFRPIARIGGDTGWYAWNRLWQIRGALDLLAGGVGMRRGRPAAATLSVGDAIDFWRVDAIEPGRRLRLVAEMKVPGRAALEFTVEEDDTGSTIRQAAEFDPLGAVGRAYWYAMLPLHELVFAGMLRGIARAAREETARASG